MLGEALGGTLCSVARMGLRSLGLGRLSGLGANEGTDPSVWEVVGRLGEVVHGLFMAWLPG